MNVYQMSMVATVGMLIAMAGISKVTGDNRNVRIMIKENG